MWIHDMINKQDIKGIRSNVNPDNVNNTNENNETPIEYMIIHYDNRWKFPISSLILQHLLNMGANKLPCLQHVQNCINDITFDSSTKKFYNQVLKANTTNINNKISSSSTTLSRSLVENNSIDNKKSQYSVQEKLQLEKIARKLGIATQNNHLALKIINRLLKNNLCIGCSQNSIICKECFNLQD